MDIKIHTHRLPLHPHCSWLPTCSSISKQMWPFLVQHDFAKWHYFVLILYCLLEPRQHFLPTTFPATNILSDILISHHYAITPETSAKVEFSAHKQNTRKRHSTVIYQKTSFPSLNSRCHSLMIFPAMQRFFLSRKHLIQQNFPELLIKHYHSSDA